MLESFGQEDEQRHAKQGADGVADEPWHELSAKAIVEEEEGRRDQDAAKAAGKCQPNGPRERTHGGMLSGGSYQLVARRW
jgi:hypothetical protein